MRANNCGPILVVDGDPDDRAFVSGLLKGAGYRTYEAETGEEAIAAARRERPGLVILDVLLPGLSGYQICRDLREEFGEQLPIILVSGEKTDPVDQVAGLLLGADEFLVKPLFPDALLARVRRLTARSGALAGPVASVLTPREREVLSLLAAGLRKADIAHRLFISPKTVGKHIERVLAKLGVHSQAQAVSLAAREGLVDGLREHFGTSRRLPEQTTR
jgi:two-component system, NarL family, nitrate/nitrite response regulator NarL